MQIDHFNITGPLPLLDELRDFYRDLLGLEDGFRPALRKPGYWLYANGKAIVHLYEGGPREALTADSLLDHIALTCDDSAPILARLGARNLEHRINRIPELALTQIFVRDPAGILLELNCREPHRSEPQ